MIKAALLVVLIFSVLLTGQAQEKKPVPDSAQQKGTVKKIVKSEADSAINATRKKVTTAKKELVNQKNTVQADVKEIYQTVFIARDTSVLKEQTLEISKELNNESKKLKTSMQELTVDNVKQSLLKEGSNEIGEVKKLAGEQRAELQSTVGKINTESVTDGARKEGQQQLNQIKSEKENLKNELKKPLDFNLSVDNNGTQTQSSQLDNLKQKSGELNDFKLDPNKPELPAGVTPNLNLKSLDMDKPDFEKLDDKIPDLNELEEKVLEGRDKIPESKSVEKLRNTIERVAEVDGTETKKTISELTNVKTILSQKQKARLLDSLGFKKFDSLYAIASPYLKKEVGKEDLLNELNKSNLGQSKIPGSAPDEEAIKGEVQNELINPLKDLNPINGKLPQSVLEELPPLSGNLVDSKYLKLVDSLRSIKLKEQRLMLDEKELSESGKEFVFKRKPKFWDKMYGEVILGILRNDNAEILQISPALGYHILPLVSVGFGPMLSVQKQDSIFNTKVGIRSFTKVEFFKQRAYFQAEYQISPYQIEYENLKVNRGNLLLGGGVVKKVYGQIAINASLMYNLSNSDPATTPWVFRLGLSKIASK